MEADVDPALFWDVTVYVVRPTASEGVPEIMHNVGDRVTPAGRAGETAHDVTAVPPVQVIIIVGKVIPTLAASSGTPVYEQPLGAVTSEGSAISVADSWSDDIITSMNYVCLDGFFQNTVVSNSTYVVHTIIEVCKYHSPLDTET